MAEKVLVAMSGGVDSSVAAYLLQQQGYACIGVTMRLYENETAGIPRGHTCCSLDDVEDARAVAYDLGMPYYVLNFTEEFDEKVIRKFVQVYQNGGTPNPCIDCNRYLKFDHLLNRARELGCDYIATGHYVQRWQDENGRWGLRKNDDPGKDQSYVLYSLTQDQLAHTLFPLGGMHKDAVRAIAEEQGLCNARKHDSQDICFVPDGDYAAFLERYTGQPMQPGQLAAVRLAMALYGGSVTSRLFLNVRERDHLCYYCSSSFQSFTGSMAVNSGVEHADAARAEAAVLKELKDLCDGPITDEELEDCRRGLLAGMNGLEDTLGGIETWYYMEVLRGGPVQTPDDARAALQAVTEEDVRTVLRQLTLSVSYLLTREEESAHA